MSIIAFNDSAALDKNISGGKGSGLAKLSVHGFPVPPGFVVTSDTFLCFLDEISLAADVEKLFDGSCDQGQVVKMAMAIKQNILDSTLPPKTKKAIAEVVDEGEKWAVRSSSMAEDMEDASFAGQYDTYLGLKSVDEITGAVLKCWASFFNEHAICYRLERNIREYRAAVVIQRLIDSDAAGVCFSVDPVSGDREQVVINANYGLGESVVSGQVTPDTFIVERDGLQIRSSIIGDKAEKIVPVAGGVETIAVTPDQRAEPCLTQKQVKAVAELALQVEAEQGAPVDIEWAFCDQKLFLLQSRPITTITPSTIDKSGIKSGADKTEADSIPPSDWCPQTNTTINPKYPLYSNGNISEVLPGCITPLSWDYSGKMIERSFRNQLIELGAISKGGPDWQVIGFFYHRPYICVSFLADVATATPGMTPDTIFEEFIGKPETKTPSIGAADLLPNRWPKLFGLLFALIKKALSIGKEIEHCQQLNREQDSTYTTEVVAGWSDEMLLDRVRVCDELTYPSMTHTWVSTFAVVHFSMLRELTAAWLADEDSSLAAQLVTGIDGLPSAEPAFGLYQLAETIKSNQKLLALFQSKPDYQVILDALKGSEEAELLRIQGELNAFLTQYGHRAVSEGEISNPSWREDPTQVIALVRNYLLPGAASPETIRRRQQAAYQQSLERVKGLNLFKRKILHSIVKRTRQKITHRELMKDLVILRVDRTRRIYREICQRLLARNLLQQSSDMYFLVWEEINHLIGGQLSVNEAKNIIDKRRDDFERCQQISVPKLQRGTPQFLSEDDISHESGSLTGMGVSPGKIEGRARVILNPRDDAYLEPGEILVAPVTDVAWTPLFIHAAGLVVEVGGLLSHGSVVAREYGLPAVVGVAGATKMIKTGDRILINGNSGVVTRL